jgi:hypothetical protein
MLLVARHEPCPEARRASRITLNPGCHTATISKAVAGLQSVPIAAPIADLRIPKRAAQPTNEQPFAFIGLQIVFSVFPNSEPEG